MESHLSDLGATKIHKMILQETDEDATNGWVHAAPRAGNSNKLFRLFQ